ncbi:MAG TPA: septum site-determining protein MinC [Paenalcaligenes sp.]|nr:septum site-determining protein MinC [Paenalcaligenes sp.]
MNESSPRKGPQALDFKSATLYTVRLVLHSNQTDELLAALAQRMHDAGSFFENEPVVIDASQVEGSIDWQALLDALNTHKLNAVGVVASGELLSSAEAAGLLEVDISNAPSRPTSPTVPEAEVPTLASTAEEKQAPEPAVQPEIITTVAPAAMVVNRQLRSGQRIYARDTDLVIIGVVGQGAEVIADGNIHVYGPLRGKAMAGARGDTTARIFTTELDPELIAIAGVYRVIEEELEPSLHKKATVIQLEDDNLNIRALS